MIEHELIKKIEEALNQLEKIFEEDENFDQNNEFQQLFIDVESDLNELEIMHESWYYGAGEKILSSLEKDELTINKLRKRYDLLEKEYGDDGDVNDLIDDIVDNMFINREEFDDDYLSEY